MRGFSEDTFGQNILHSRNSMNKCMKTPHNVSLLLVDRKARNQHGAFGQVDVVQSRARVMGDVGKESHEATVRGCKSCVN